MVVSLVDDISSKLSSINKISSTNRISTQISEPINIKYKTIDSGIKL